MEEFDSIVWTTPMEDFSDVISSQTLKRNSYAYKILHGAIPWTASSDSSSSEEEIPKEPAKKKKKNESEPKMKQDNATRQQEHCLHSLSEKEPLTSSLTIQQHSYYVDVMTAIKKHVIGIPPHEFQELRQDVEREQNEFQQYIKQLWPTAFQKHHILADDVMRFISDVWKCKLNIVKSYPSSYSLQKMIPLVYSAQSANVQLSPVQVLLEMGLVPKLLIPKLKSYQICTDYSKMSLMNASCKESSNTSCKMPVSRDGTAEHLAVTHKANVVISSSSLKCLSTNLPPSFDKTWDMPVIVRDYSVKDGDKLFIKKVVFIDKPLPPKHLSASERNFWFHKIALKKCLCHARDPEVFRYPNEEYISLCDKSIQKPSRTLCCYCGGFLQSGSGKNDSVSQKSDYDSSDSEQLVIDIHSDTDRKSQRLQSPKAGETICTCGQNLHSNYKDRDSSVSIEDKKDMVDVIRPPSTTNVTYKMWKLHCEGRSKEDLHESFLKGQTVHQEINILVRCKLDACKVEKKKIQPFCVSPKLEYQSEYGAETMSLSGLVRDWTTLFFRPEASIARVHIDAVTEEIIMTEEVKTQDVAQQAMNMYKFRIRSSVSGTLYSVLSSLTCLEAGHYLLSHVPKNGAFVSLLQCNNSINNYNIHEEFAAVRPDLLLKRGIPPWTPIDTTLLTPAHISSKHIPCTFAPVSKSVKKKPKKD